MLVMHCAEVHPQSRICCWFAWQTADDLFFDTAPGTFTACDKLGYLNVAVL